MILAVRVDFSKVDIFADVSCAQKSNELISRIQSCVMYFN